jgi:DDE_Tnp_1-associated
LKRSIVGSRGRGLAHAFVHALLELLLAVSDGRSDQGRDHPLAVVLALVEAATVAGLKGYTAISGWVADAPAGLLDGLYTRVDARPAGRPSRSTIWRVCTDTDTDVLDAVIAAWTAAQRSHRPEQAPTSAGTPMQARLDGKSVRGAVDAHGEQLHLLSALAGAPGPDPAAVVIAQAPTDGAKTTEPATARTLIESPSTCGTPPSPRTRCTPSKPPPTGTLA